MRSGADEEDPELEAADPELDGRGGASPATPRYMTPRSSTLDRTCSPRSATPAAAPRHMTPRSVTPRDVTPRHNTRCPGIEFAHIELDDAPREHAPRQHDLSLPDSSRSRPMTPQRFERPGPRHRTRPRKTRAPCRDGCSGPSGGHGHARGGAASADAARRRLTAAIEERYDEPPDGESSSSRRCRKNLGAGSPEPESTNEPHRRLHVDAAELWFLGRITSDEHAFPPLPGLAESAFDEEVAEAAAEAVAEAEEPGGREGTQSVPAATLQRHALDRQR